MSWVESPRAERPGLAPQEAGQLVLLRKGSRLQASTNHDLQSLLETTETQPLVTTNYSDPDPPTKYTEQ